MALIDELKKIQVSEEEIARRTKEEAEKRRIKLQAGVEEAIDRCYKDLSYKCKKVSESSMDRRASVSVYIGIFYGEEYLDEVRNKVAKMIADNGLKLESISFEKDSFYGDRGDCNIKVSW